MNKTGFQAFALSPEISRALRSLGYGKPTEVQSKVLPLALQRQDIVVQSATGSGKTAAFGIPLCELIDWQENMPQVLILTPTRELAVQVKEDIQNIGRYKRVKAIPLFGKQSFIKQKNELKQKNHVVVGTPGRVLDHIRKGTLPLERVKALVLDEADEMLNMGFIEQVEAIIQEVPQERVTMLFSATMPTAVKQLATAFMKQPTHIEMQTQEEATDRIEHGYYEVQEKDKFSLLLDVLTVQNPESCILFCRTHEQVNQLLNRLADLDYSCDKIHGGMYQEDRFAVMEDFRRGVFRYLVATDVAARGIDIDSITLVLNYDCPQDKESYVHRIGRTGRAGKTGQALSFITPSELALFKEIIASTGFSIHKHEYPTQAEVESKRKAFEQKMRIEPSLKPAKGTELNKDIMKLYFNGGKKKKLRAVDFVGTIAKIEGVTADDIGIITIQDKESYVEILNGKGPLVLQAMKSTTIKGKQLKVHKAFK